MILLDASAALAYLFAEPGGEKVKANLATATITSVNMIEVFRHLRRTLGQQAPTAYAMFKAQLTIEDVRADDVDQASWIYAQYQRSHNISLGDAVCLAVGQRLQCEVWTTDKAWDTLLQVGCVRVIR